jgi:Domain of unknown function (DUF4283)
LLSKNQKHSICISEKLQASKNQKHSSNQTMAENFYEERPDVTTVYFESREHLNQYTQYLYRAGLVILRRGARNPDLKVPIATAIAAWIGWTPNNFEVYSYRLAHYIVLCPGHNNRSHVASMGPYRIVGTDLEFDVHVWEPRFNMMFYPLSFHTWIALRGAPLQTWSRTEITRLVQRFGYPIRIYPYALPSGQFMELRMVIEGEHPRDIHKHILFRERAYATIIDVHIHRWFEVVSDPPSPPPDRHDRQAEQSQKRQRN